ncbi:MAG: type II toxin-antitoxin system HicA family toxin [Saprospiraceae bacterium]
MKTLSGLEVCKILEKNGFENVRQKGSHCIMQKKSENTTISIPVPIHKELRIGTLMSIIRQSGLGKKVFE